MGSKGNLTKSPPVASMADALFGKTQRRVLALLFGNPERSYFANEVVRLAESGIGAVHRELAGLEAAGLVSVTRLGNQKHYQANPRAPIFEELCGIARKTFGVGDVLPEKVSRLAGAQARAEARPTLHSSTAAYGPSAARVAPFARLNFSKERLAKLCRKYHVRKLSLFGSAARNQLTEESDVDLLVEFDPHAGVTLFELPALQEELSALFGHRSVDLATPQILENPYRRKSILPDLKTLYAAG